MDDHPRPFDGRTMVAAGCLFVAALVELSLVPARPGADSVARGTMGVLFLGGAIANGW